MRDTNNYRTLWMLLFLVIPAILFFTSCEELVEDSGDQDQVSLNADAGQDMTVEVGTDVTLDGSSSSASEGSFIYMWSFTDKPSGSTATLQDASTAAPSFTPDAEGDYTLELVISNGEQDDSDEVTITASAGSSDPSTIEVSGEINSGTVWEDHVSDPSVPDYLVTSHVYVNAALEIDPGVLIHVQENQGVYVNANGTLMSNGTSQQPVVIESSDAPGGLLWRGLKIVSSNAQNKLEHTRIAHAGHSEIGFSGADYVTAIGIEGGNLSLVNTTVENSGGYGLFLHSGSLDTFSENHFAGNTSYGILISAGEAGKLDAATTFADAGKAVELYHSTLEASTETTWPALAGDARYYVSGDLSVNSYLQIQPGALFDFEEDKSLNIYSNGVLVADAAGQEQIVFTSQKAASGIHWQGIYVNSNDARNILANVEVSYAGNSEWNFSGYNYTGAIGIEDGKIGIEHTTISHSSGYGIFVKTGGFVSFQSNTLDNNGYAIALMANQAGMIDEATAFTNNTWNGVEVYNSTMDQESVWVDLMGDAKYLISGYLSVQAGWTLDPGAYLAVEQDDMIKVGSSGYIVADGTSSAPITLTTSNPEGQILWGGLWIASADARNVLDYVTIDYAGGTDMGFSGPNYITALGGDNDDTPRVSLTNSTITNSGGYAVFWEGGTINDVESAAANNTFSNNAENPDVVIP